MANISDLQAQIKVLQKQVRLEKGRLEREELVTMLEPMFSAIDTAIEDNPDLQEYLTVKDALRFYVVEEDGELVVNRETYRSYKSREFNGGDGTGSSGSGKSVEIDMDGEGDWRAFSSHAAVCREFEFPTNGNSPVRVVHANLPEDRIRSVTTTGGG